ncbi:MAG: formylglycine-generating enzyme family protein [Bacteroidales bacterium]
MEAIKEKVNELSFTLLPIPGGTFLMGNENELATRNVHKVEISDFYLTEIPVTVSLFYQFAREVIENGEHEESGSYMWMKSGFRFTGGINWQHDEKGQLRTHFNDNRPIVNVSWYEADAFCQWLGRKTGKPYRLPTEAEWEYAAKRGVTGADLPNLTKSGFDPVQLDEMAWYRSNSGSSLHPAGLKSSNKFGLHDMIGNVWEWCNDWHSPIYYRYSAFQNPGGPSAGINKIYRGGGWDTTPSFCTPTYRGMDKPEKRFNFTGFRLALDTLAGKETADFHPAFIRICSACGQKNFFGNESCRSCDAPGFMPLLPKQASSVSIDQAFTQPGMEPLRVQGRISDPGNSKIVTGRIGKVEFKMLPIEGGTFTMGKGISNSGLLRHLVTLDGFFMGQVPVTQALWMEVMDFNPSEITGADLPVTNINWYDAEAFTLKLACLTGQNYRLPTEAEWEFAARGGNLSRNTRYAGSNRLTEVGVFNQKRGNYGPGPVATLKPNELGLYDMSGNVLEWCSDWFNDYPGTPQVNPKGPASGSDRVQRGGYFYTSAPGCRIITRAYGNPLRYMSWYGFRLALS